MANPLRERLAWYANRLKAMSVPEVVWRVQQKALQKREKRRFGKRTNVAEVLLYPDLTAETAGAPLSTRFNAIAVAPAGILRPTGESVGQLKADDWSLSGLTGKHWPDQWAYDLEYKQCDSIGDARLTWETHRHFQWPRLAINYRATGDEEYLKELIHQFGSWTSANPVLYGIGWTSVMEVAIRSLQWLMTASILQGMDHQTSESMALIEGLLTGSANMTSYVAGHRSRFSSANNHLLVELAAIGVAGLAFGHEPWVRTATDELTTQLPLQFSEEGVNLEVSLHYHTFAMEAYLTLMRALRMAGRDVPESWREMMCRAARFVRASMASESTAIEFGDADKGKLTDLTGNGFDYYRYLLQSASIETGKNLSLSGSPEPTIAALYPEAETAITATAPGEEMRLLEIFDATPRDQRNHARSGFVYMRTADGHTLVGIDCAPLGFGSIAAHGHADMLSFQLFDNGKPVLTDGGTYLYHCGLADRNLRRSELMHNTLHRPGHPQGEMRGPFLWGKRGSCRIEAYDRQAGETSITCRAESTDGTGWERKFHLDSTDGTLTITDSQITAADTATFIAAPGTEVRLKGRTATIGNRTLTADSGELRLEKVAVAPEYGCLADTTAIRVTGRHGSGTVRIALT